jgi:hypothetical protein
MLRLMLRLGCGQPDAPVRDFYLASVRAARRLPYSLETAHSHTPRAGELEP